VLLAIVLVEIALRSVLVSLSVIGGSCCRSPLDRVVTVAALMGSVFAGFTLDDSAITSRSGCPRDTHPHRRLPDPHDADPGRDEPAQSARLVVAEMP
jgi:hypothetical protein